MKNAKPAPKPRNPVARDIRTARFCKRIVRSRKTYRRNARGADRHGDTG